MMKYSIVYSSQTGNTAALSRSLRESLPKEDCDYYGPPSPEAGRGTVIFIGFWTNKGNCDPDSQNFLRTLHFKKLFLFGTAGFGGSAKYYRDIFQNVEKQIPSSNKILGEFLCQGRMPATVRQRYEAMLKEDPKNTELSSLLQNFDSAASHPNKVDFDLLYQKASAALEGL